jgi:hypothetical protein
MTVARQTRGSRVLLAALVAGVVLVSGAKVRADDVPLKQRAVRLEEIPQEEGKKPVNGFRIVVTKEAAEKLRDLVNDQVDQDKLMAEFGSLAKQPLVKAQLAVVFSNADKFKKELNDKMGKEGVIITITGSRLTDLAADAYPPLKNLDPEMIKKMLPRRLRGLAAAANTNPAMALVSNWYWSIEPRDEDTNKDGDKQP